MIPIPVNAGIVIGLGRLLFRKWDFCVQKLNTKSHENIL